MICRFTADASSLSAGTAGSIGTAAVTNNGTLIFSRSPVASVNITAVTEPAAALLSRLYKWVMEAAETVPKSR